MNQRELYTEVEDEDPDDNDLPKTTNEWFEKISSQLSFTNWLLFLIMMASWLGAGH